MQKNKGKGCADGRKQCEYLTKDDTNEPTVAMGSLFLTFLINAMENRNVATVIYLDSSCKQTWKVIQCM